MVDLITVHDLDSETLQRLTARAEAHARTVDAEARAILTEVLAAPATGYGLGSKIAALFADVEDGEPLLGSPLAETGGRESDTVCSCPPAAPDDRDCARQD